MGDDEAHRPVPAGAAARAVARCALVTIGLLLRRRLRLPQESLGLTMAFTDGTAARVFRETVVARPAPRDPCVLVVKFRLRCVRGRGHALFRRESLLNTVLFAGFLGLVSKLWLGNDEHGIYRGVYEWDGPAAAAAYARALWQVLALVSVPGSIDYHVLPGLRRDDLFAAAGRAGDPVAWWQPAAVTRGAARRRRSSRRWGRPGRPAPGRR